MRDLPCCAEIYGLFVGAASVHVLLAAPLVDREKKMGVAQSFALLFLNFHFLSCRKSREKMVTINEESRTWLCRSRDNYSFTQFVLPENERTIWNRD